MEEQEIIKTPAPAPFFSQVLRVFRVTGLGPISRKKGVLMFLLAFLPVILIALGHILGGARAEGALFFMKSMVLFFHYINQIVFIFIGCSILGESIEDKTITYDILCPISRLAVYVGKTLSYTVSVFLLLLPPLCISYFLCMYFIDMETVIRNLPILGAVVLMTGLSALIYGALFIMVSMTLKRSVLVCIVYAMIFEGFVANVPIKLHLISLHVHFRNLASTFANEPMLMKMPAYTIDVAPVTSLMVCLGALFVFLFVGGVVFRGKQLV